MPFHNFAFCLGPQSSVLTFITAPVDITEVFSGDYRYYVPLSLTIHPGRDPSRSDNQIGPGQLSPSCFIPLIGINKLNICQHSFESRERVPRASAPLRLPPRYPASDRGRPISMPGVRSFRDRSTGLSAWKNRTEFCRGYIADACLGWRFRVATSPVVFRRFILTKDRVAYGMDKQVLPKRRTFTLRIERILCQKL